MCNAQPTTTDRYEQHAAILSRRWIEELHGEEWTPNACETCSTPLAVRVIRDANERPLELAYACPSDCTLPIRNRDARPAPRTMTEAREQIEAHGQGWPSCEFAHGELVLSRRFDKHGTFVEFDLVCPVCGGDDEYDPEEFADVQ